MKSRTAARLAAAAFALSFAGVLVVVSSGSLGALLKAPGSTWELHSKLTS